MKITHELIVTIAPKANKSIINGLVSYLGPALEKYEINTRLRLVHFLAQAAHETDGFKTLTEYASGAAYEGRKDLGNLQPGDGKKYKGRGIFQLTGRANYKKYGTILNINLEEDPLKASTPEYAVLTACEYWNDKKLNTFADLDDIHTITKKINGGYNGLEDRKIYLERAKSIIKD